MCSVKVTCRSSPDSSKAGGCKTILTQAVGGAHQQLYLHLQRPKSLWQPNRGHPPQRSGFHKELRGGSRPEEHFRRHAIIQKIDTNETTFFFASDSPLDKEGWIGAIGILWEMQERPWFAPTICTLMTDCSAYFYYPFYASTAQAAIIHEIYC